MRLPPYLREIPGVPKPSYQLVGDAYIDELMAGEAVLGPMPGGYHSI